jgi:hypothetical protein
MSTVQSTTRSTTWNPLNQVYLGPRSCAISSSLSRRRIWIVYHKSEEDLDHIPQVRGEFGSSAMSRRRIWIIYHKSEENLDRLPQVGGRLATVHRRVPVSADYLDFFNDTLPLSNGHQGLRSPPTWSGGPGHRKGMESSKLLGLAQFSTFSTWSGQAQASEGH